MLYCGGIIKRTLCNFCNSASAMTLSLRLTAQRVQFGPAQPRFLPVGMMYQIGVGFCIRMCIVR